MKSRVAARCSRQLIFAYGRGARAVKAAAVHGVFSGVGAGANRRVSHRVGARDRLLPLATGAHAKVEQLSVAALFARAIAGIHGGTSVFELPQ